MAKRQVSLTLKRAYFSEEFEGTLEEAITASFDALETTRDRVIPLDMFSERAFISFESTNRGSGRILRIFDYEKGATGVVNLDTTNAAEAVEAFEHPDNKDFLKKQIVLLVRGNHLFCCGVENKAGTLGLDMLQLAQNASALPRDFYMRVADVPSIHELQRLNEVGVKKMHFDLASYFETLNLKRNQIPGTRVLGMMFGDRPSADRSRRRGATFGKITLSRGKFRPDEIQKDEWLTEIGEEILRGGSAEKYTIELEDGTSIKPDELQKSKTVRLSRHANTFSYSNAVAELVEFADECESDGSLGT